MDCCPLPLPLNSPLDFLDNSMLFLLVLDQHLCLDVVLRCLYNFNCHFILLPPLRFVNLGVLVMDRLLRTAKFYTLLLVLQKFRATRNGEHPSTRFLHLGQRTHASHRSLRHLCLERIVGCLQLHHQKRFNCMPPGVYHILEPQEGKTALRHPIAQIRLFPPWRNSWLPQSLLNHPLAFLHHLQKMTCIIKIHSSLSMPAPPP